MYKELFELSSDFRLSINLLYDIDDEKRVNQYIPNEEIAIMMKDYLKGISGFKAENSSGKNRVLIGAYGKGKSHFILAALGLLDHSINSELLESRFSKLDREFRELFDYITGSSIMPVIVNPKAESIDQGIRVALSNALETRGINKIHYESRFDSILVQIDRWESEHPSIIDLFSSYLERKDQNLEIFMRSIENFNNSSLDVFDEFFEQLTGGTKFNPLASDDIESLIISVNSQLKESCEYNGILIVFDEFSKYLERISANQLSKDLITLQTLAELSDRSNNPSLAVTLITHKPIEQYVAKISEEKVNAWRAVEGRYNDLFFQVSSEQHVKLIGESIVKRPGYREFIDKVYEELDMNTLKGCSSWISTEFADAFNLIKYECFPMNPFAVGALVAMSERVGQNERSMFTFLHENDRSSLTDYLMNDGQAPLLSIDVLFDYFEPMFRKEKYDENIVRLYRLVSYHCDAEIDEMEKRLVKSIGLIQMINNPRIISSSVDSIRFALQIDENRSRELLNKLLDNRKIRLSKHDQTYELTSARTQDINELINNAQVSRFDNDKILETLSENFIFEYTLPREYNHEHKMTRYLKHVFLLDTQAEQLRDLMLQYVGSDYDGIIINILNTSRMDPVENRELLEAIYQLIDDYPGVIVRLSINRFDSSFIDDLSDYYAISKLQSQAKSDYDEELIGELNFLIEDYYRSIDNRLQMSFYQNETYAFYMSENDFIKKKDILSDSVLSKISSKVIHSKFPRTPVINNELINKHNVSSQVKRARDEIVDYILNEYTGEFSEKLEGLSLEATLYRVMILNKGLRESNSSNDNHLNEVLKLVDEEIKKSIDEKINFSKLLGRLTSAPYGVREGIIPVYLAYVMKNYLKELSVYYRDQELVITSNILDRITSNPEDYSIVCDDPNEGEMIKLLSLILDEFHEFTEPNQSKSNHYFVAYNAMRSFFRKLPRVSQRFLKDAKTQNSIEDEIVQLRNEMIKSSISPRTFFQNVVYEIYEGSDYVEIFMNIKKFKDQSSRYLDELESEVIKYALRTIDPNYDGSLSSLLHHENEKFEHIAQLGGLPANVESLVEVSRMDSYSDHHIVNQLAKQLTGLHISDWTEDNVMGFKESLKLAFDYFASVAQRSSEDTKPEMSVRIEDLSDHGKNLLGELEEIIEEYGEGINSQERKSILKYLMNKNRVV